MLKKIITGSLVIVLVLIALPVFAGGNRGASQQASALKGQHIIIGNWWEDYNVKTREARNSAEERTLAWRTKIQNDYGFIMEEKNIASWGEFNDGYVVTQIMTGSPSASIYVLQGAWAMAVINQGLAKPLNVASLRNPQPVEAGMLPPRWNQSTLDTFNFGGKVYAFSNDINMTNVICVFFNKRLFREAGLDPDLPYNMQKDGTWNWENFITICRQLTRDIDNDGIIDTYAMCQDFASEILNGAISSNGAQFVGKDASGRFYNATNSPAFLEGLNYVLRLKNEGIMKAPAEGANWDWFKGEFLDGNVAMRIEDSYIWGEMQNMRDDWGVVLFPKGPRVDNYRVYTRENVMIIPSTYSDAQAEQILNAAALWYTPQDDDWKAGWYNTFRDSRAVDETLAYFRDTSLHIHKNSVLIPGLNIGDIAWQMYWWEGDPAQLVESVSPNWNALINEVNAQLFK